MDTISVQKFSVLQLCAGNFNDFNTPTIMHFTLLKITNYTQCQVDFHMHVPLKKNTVSISAVHVFYIY